MTDFVQANALEQDSLINLIKVRTVDNQFIYIADKFPCDYLGDHYEKLDNNLTGASQQEGDEESRPNWKFANPNFAFNSLVLNNNSLEGALVTRYQMRVKYTPDLVLELVSNNVWQLFQVVSVGTEINCQLRTLTDIPAARLPRRGFYPPGFPHVKV